MDKDSRIYVAGHRGMVGSAIQRKLQEYGYNNLIVFTSDEYDLREQQQVRRLFNDHNPEYVILAAAKVGGIVANNEKRAEFIYDNIMIEANVINQSYLSGVKKLLNLGSSCIYPKFADQPIAEESLLTGSLEPTNEPYAIAKIAGLKMCEAYHDQYGCNFISLMPTNLYGYNDNYDLNNSHVLPALIRKFHEANIKGEDNVVVWGTGTPKREFLFADDLAEAAIYLMENYNGKEPINVGTGEDISIRELAEIIGGVVGFKGKIIFDTTKPDGTPRKLLNVSKLHELGFKHKTRLQEGIEKVYQDFKNNYNVIVA